MIAFLSGHESYIALIFLATCQDTMFFRLYVFDLIKGPYKYKNNTNQVDFQGFIFR